METPAAGTIGSLVIALRCGDPTLGRTSPLRLVRRGKLGYFAPWCAVGGGMMPPAELGGW